MPARKEHKSDKMPSELERDAKCQMEPLLAGALLHRLSDVDLLRLNGWLDMERRAAADELWERHTDTITASKKRLAALKAFIDVNKRNGYEFDSNEPEVYRLILDAIGEGEE